MILNWPNYQGFGMMRVSEEAILWGIKNTSYKSMKMKRWRRTKEEIARLNRRYESQERNWRDELEVQVQRSN